MTCHSTWPFAPHTVEGMEIRGCGRVRRHRHRQMDGRHASGCAARTRRVAATVQTAVPFDAARFGRVCQVLETLVGRASRGVRLFLLRFLLILLLLLCPPFFVTFDFSSSCCLLPCVWARLPYAPRMRALAGKGVQFSTSGYPKRRSRWCRAHMQTTMSL